MELSVCHYSFHRTWLEENWNILRLAEEVKRLGIAGIDFHAGFLGTTEHAAESIADALDRTGLRLSGLSLNCNFAQAEPDALAQEIERTISWMKVASRLGAPVARVFGSAQPSGLLVHSLDDKVTETQRLQHKETIVASLEEIAREAECLNLMLALENHYGFPLTGEEQVEIIESVGNNHLRATIDVGNYMSGGQDPLIGTALVAPHLAYVHVKDYSRVENASVTSGWSLMPCSVGAGDVDIKGCLGILKENGYDGFVAIEYEGKEEERTGVAKSVDYLNQLSEFFE